MEVKINKFSSYYILDINGELDFINSFKFKELINSIIEENINNVIIDFQNLSFIDSSGIGALLKTSIKIYKSNNLVTRNRTSISRTYIPIKIC